MKKERCKASFKNTGFPVTNEDLEDSTNKRMLSDNVIYGFNILCRRQFDVAELQDPLLGQISQYSAMKNKNLYKFCITTGLIGLLSAHVIVKTAKLSITTAYFRAE